MFEKINNVFCLFCIGFDEVRWIDKEDRKKFCYNFVFFIIIFFWVFFYERFMGEEYGRECFFLGWIVFIF